MPLIPLPLSSRIKTTRQRLKGDETVIAKPIGQAKGIESAYRKRLVDGLKIVRDDVYENLFPLLERLAPFYTTDSIYTSDDWISDLESALSLLRTKWTVSDSDAIRFASNLVGNVDRSTRARLNKTLGNAIGVDVNTMLKTEGQDNVVDLAIEENARLIKDLPESYIEGIEQVVRNATSQGFRPSQIEQEIRKKFGVSERRAKLIARDQVLKAQASITRSRQTALGIRGYRWRTSEDERVRSTHKARNGKAYAWKLDDVGKKLSDGTKLLNPFKDGIGHPGNEINCRCEPEAIIEL